MKIALKFGSGINYSDFVADFLAVEEFNDLEGVKLQHDTDTVVVDSLDYDLYRLDLEALVQQHGGSVEFLSN